MKQNEYMMRINQAINYIHEHIDKNLTVEDIAQRCCFSKYYFNRIFKSMVGESIYSFVKRLKLENAAFKLRTSHRKTLTEIGFEIGYSPSNFATVFKEYFGMSPSDYRRYNNVPIKDSYKEIIEHIASFKKQEDFFQRVQSKITIKKLPEMILEYQRFIGNYYDMSTAWESFCREMEKKYPLEENKIYCGISYDDPLIADENKCIYDMCVKVNKVTGINTHRIPATTYACYYYNDSIENLGKAYNEIFALWLPYSKYSIDNRPPIEIYLSPQDEENKMKIDLSIPIIEG
ncbi:AraC family transcriptional regulator [Natronincola peptidivorans]|uniref:AraC family transcriptional regulator n=1 Tax=Natronincola peptidivorans TaxID=426128 RepID=A0A1I0AZ25_9FIRM|nr:AraC family transcriptional regulator [Natronincola peptidivorans]SES99272.1 AraC family transcriptional regulator [Natronincola peptidivorans]